MLGPVKQPNEYAQERKAFLLWLNAGTDVPDASRNYALNLLGRAMREELSEKQLLYITAYYVDGKTMREIGKMYGVDATTVSRTIARAKKRMEKVLRYSNPTFLKHSLDGTIKIPKRSYQKARTHDE